MFPAALYIFAIIELIFVSYLDFKYKKISNYWSLVNLIGFFILLFLYPDLFSFSLHTFFYPLVFLGVGFFLFVVKVMGGGDSKFLFSFFLAIPESYHEAFFLKLIYSTVVVGLTLFIFNTFKNFDKIKVVIATKDIKHLKDVYGTKFAYAPVIALSWILFGWEIRKIFSF